MRVYRRNKRRGFTLVEVIVVLVILAILSAIGIPALTGYIDKANDRKYSTDAHKAHMAYRTLLGEEYADGTLGRGIPDTGPYKDYLSEGDAVLGNPCTHLKTFTFSYVSVFASTGTPTASKNEDWYLYINKTLELVGEPVPVKTQEDPFWEMVFIAPNLSGYTILNAPAFLYKYYPDGNKKGKEAVFVFHKIAGLNDEYATSKDLLQALANDGQYDQAAGYRTFHITLS